LKGISEFIKEHNAYLHKTELDQTALAYHLIQIGFLQHERLVHLIVMLFIALCTLICLALYLLFSLWLFVVAFGLLLLLTLFYILHYYKLENTVIQWYWVYDEHIKRNPHQWT
jgi:hypothetical protein